MRNIIGVCLVFVSLSGFAQPKGYQAVKNVAAFQQQLNKNNTSVQTIASDFIQTKNLALLSEKVKSKGKFYFQKQDKVRIEYTSPFSYLLVMNGNQVMVKDEQKTSKINTKNSKAMQSVNRIMIDCMQGTVFQNPDFSVTAYESANGYLLSMLPSNDAMRKMFKQIDIYMDKKSLDVDRLTMTETGGDFTDMDFTGTQHNTALNESLFKIR
ncbi:MAG: outer membrane lipoprotein carrier protein LolA [Bacteroidetes bacterium]|nr:outer membrane lipoprotein carrier protein LolA [Bacteroidota bacterium]